MKNQRAIYTVCLGSDMPRPPVIISNLAMPKYLITDCQRKLSGLGDWEVIRIQNPPTSSREREAKYLGLKYYPDQLVALPKSRVFIDCSIESISNVESFFEYAEASGASLVSYFSSKPTPLNEAYIEAFTRGGDYPVTIFDSFHLLSSRASLGLTAFDSSVYWYENDESYGHFQRELTQHLKYRTVQEDLVVPSILMELCLHVANGYISTNHSEERINNPRLRNEIPPARFLDLNLLERILRRLFGLVAFQANKSNELARKAIRWLLIKADFRSFWEAT